MSNQQSELSRMLEHSLAGELEQTISLCEMLTTGWESQGNIFTFDNMSSQYPEEARAIGVAQTELGQDVKSTNNTEACAICFENKKQLAPQECHHLCMCFTCARQIIAQQEVKCPICRAVIRLKMEHIYL